MTHLDKLLSVIDGEIEASPLSHLDMAWCSLSQAELAERAAISEATLRRTLRGKQKQITRFTCVRDGQRVTLLRRADGKESPVFRAVLDQRIMAAEFKRHTGQKTVAPAQYGCLFELCKAWPAKHRLAVFRYALQNWTEFMASYKLTVSLDPEAYPNEL